MSIKIFKNKKLKYKSLKFLLPKKIKRISKFEYSLKDLGFVISKNNRALFKVGFKDNKSLEFFDKDDSSVSGIYSFFHKDYEEYLNSPGKYCASGILRFENVRGKRTVFIFTPKKIQKF